MKALILAPFLPWALNRLNQRIQISYESWLETKRLIPPEELIQRIEGEGIGILVIEADFVLEEVLEGVNRLKFIGVCRGNITNVDVNMATEKGIIVVNTPGRNAIAVAELTIGLMLSLSRNIPKAHYWVKWGEWLDPVSPYFSLRGRELWGKTVGIIGLGAIGFEVAQRLKVFNMNILVYDPYVSQERVGLIKGRLVDLNTLLKESDYVTVHCPLTPDTIGLINRERISLMKSTAYLINTARAEIVDEKALALALKEGYIAGAALDVYETLPISPQSPLLKLNNVLFTPYIGGATDGTVERYCRMMVEDIERFLKGECPRNIVNPEVWKANV